MIKIEVSGLKEAIKYVEDKNKKASKKINKGIKNATFFVFGEVKASIAGRRNEPTSVDTGRFLNTVEMESFGKDAIVFSRLPYSKYLEYGTSRMRARRHFHNTKSRSMHKVKAILNEEIKNI